MVRSNSILRDQISRVNYPSTREFTDVRNARLPRSSVASATPRTSVSLVGRSPRALSDLSGPSAESNDPTWALAQAHRPGLMDPPEIRVQNLASNAGLRPDSKRSAMIGDNYRAGPSPRPSGFIALASGRAKITLKALERDRQQPRVRANDRL